MRLGWTACGLLWCLAIVSDARSLGQRQNTVESPSSSSSSAIPPSSSTGTAASFATSPSPSTSSLPALPAAPDTPPTSPPRPVPTPLDLTISYSLSDDCVMFMTSFLTNTLFRSCLPFSLLLTTSTSYRQLVAQAPDDEYATLNNLLAYTSSPQPSAQQCDDYFAGLTRSFGEKKHCGADLRGDMPNPVAMDAKRGLGNYQVVREASALKDPESGAYCYIQAMADPRPDDMYLWSLPAGIPLPRSSTPTCSPCSASLLNHYASSASSTLNSTIILDAINTVNSACGGSLVAYNNVSVPNSAATGRSSYVGPAVFSLAAMAFMPMLWTI